MAKRTGIVLARCRFCGYRVSNFGDVCDACASNMPACRECGGAFVSPSCDSCCGGCDHR